ncbi:MAG: hypothetical protein QOJ35_3820 [Solirubrobacteraceae bacterium]|jgi:hypothetical protein|nr:hypothetical protein [Solirubrobacteraceae bacterium]
MDDLPPGAAYLAYDGHALYAGEGPGRRFAIDARCLAGEPVAGAYAHVCALADPAAALRFDEPEVQQVRRDAYAWWVPLLGDALVCLTTLAIDASRYGGAITVTRRPVDWHADPFARIFPGSVLRTSLFADVPPPPGPVIERYAGVAWPGGSF